MASRAAAWSWRAASLAFSSRATSAVAASLSPRSTYAGPRHSPSAVSRLSAAVAGSSASSRAPRSASAAKRSASTDSGRTRSTYPGPWRSRMPVGARDGRSGSRDLRSLVT